MEVDVKLTLKDYMDFNYAYFYRKLRDSLRAFRVFGIIVVILILASLLTMFLLGDNKGNIGIEPQINDWVFIAVLAVLGFLFLFSILLFVNINIASRMNFQSNKLVQDKQHYMFSNGAIEITSDSISAKITWDKINSIAFYKNCYALFISTAQAYILPRRFFSDEISIKAFEELIMSNLPKEKIKR